MPTENQSTDPRDLFVTSNPTGLTSEELEKGRSGFVDHRTHADYLVFLAGYEAGKPVEQHQREPDAWLVTNSGMRAAYIRDPARWAHGYSVRPLYTHADPGEADLLRAELETVRSERDAFGQNAIDLQARLNKQDALLREFLEIATSGFADAEHVLRVRRDLQAALLADLPSSSSCTQDSAPDETWSLTHEAESFIYDSLEELVGENSGDNRVCECFELAAGDTVHRGEKHYPDPATFIDAERVRLEIEDHMSDNARANGFAEVCDGYPKASEQACIELESLLEGWARRHCKPTFYNVRNVREYIITTEDLAQSH